MMSTFAVSSVPSKLLSLTEGNHDLYRAPSNRVGQKHPPGATASYVLVSCMQILRQLGVGPLGNAPLVETYKSIIK